MSMCNDFLGPLALCGCRERHCLPGVPMTLCTWEQATPMNLLIVHQSFPEQYCHLAAVLDAITCRMRVAVDSPLSRAIRPVSAAAIKQR